MLNISLSLNIFFLCLDGVSTVNRVETLIEAGTAHMEGITIFSIGVGLTDFRELDQIASYPPKDHSFKVANFDELSRVDDLLFNAACPSKLLFS